MSDFAGVWRLDGAPADRSLLGRIGAALDGKNVARVQIATDGSFGVVHRQHFFSPEDAAEQMPIALRSGGMVVADCRLNARADLARSVDLPPQSPDGALITAAFDRWTASAFPKLHGDYAIAAWSRVEQRLYLARDPAGYRTLYWFRGAGMIAFSTRLRALLTLADVPRDLDDSAVANFLILNHGPPEQTLYRAIQRVPMGHLAILEPHRTSLSAHWTAPEPGSLRHRCDDDYVEHGREVLDKAVADALRTTNPPTLLLTGGLDSTAIAESAVRSRAPEKLLAVTRKPQSMPHEGNGRYFDETTRVAALAARLPGLDWHSVGDEDDGSDELDARRFFLEAGAPSRAPNNVAWFFPVYRFMHQRGSQVSIGGEQGNTYFSDDGSRFLPELLLGLRLPSLLQGLRVHARTNHQSLARSMLFALRAFEPLAWRLRRTRQPEAPWHSHCALGPGLASDLRLGETLDVGRYRMRLGAGHRSAQQVRRWIFNDEVARDFRGPFRAMTGIEHRVPLADRRVVEYFGALPFEQFVLHGMTRSIARRILRDRAPDDTVFGTASGVQNGDWFERISRQRAKMMQDVRRLKDRPAVARAVDLDRIESLLKDWPDDIEAAESRRGEYLQLLTRGMEMARFIEWHSGGN